MIVGAGSGPAVVLAVGARGRGRSGIVYPADPLALEHGVGVGAGNDEAGRGVRGLPAPHPLRVPPGLAARVASARALAEIADSFFRPAVNDLVPYEPGKPVEEVQRELGLERVVKLASNEGPYGPFPEAREAIERATAELNRYPDGGAYRLRAALAERFDLRFEEVAVGAGSDGLVDCLTQAALEPGDEIVCGWPSFPSYVIDARKVGAVPRTVPLRDGRYDLEAMLEAIGPRTKIAYVCLPNNPTGHDQHARRARRLVRARARARRHRARPGLRRVHRRPGLPGRRRGLPEAGPPRRRPAHLLEDLRARRAAGRLRARAGRDRHRDRQGAARVRHHHARAGGRAREPRLAGRARAPPARERRRARASSSGSCASTASTRSGPRSRTSSSPRSARTRARSSSSCSAKA